MNVRRRILKGTAGSTYGEDFIHVMNSGLPEIESSWASADEIFENSEVDKSSFDEASGNRKFTSIYNFLCDTDILPAFHDSPPYEIRVSAYDAETVIDAWENVTGDSFEQENRPSTDTSEPSTDIFASASQLHYSRWIPTGRRQWNWKSLEKDLKAV